MREKILKNEADFLEWKECLSSDDLTAPPLKYPCIASTKVDSWRYETEEAFYTYREDVAAILAELDAEIAKQNGIGGE